MTGTKPERSGTSRRPAAAWAWLALLLPVMGCDGPTAGVAELSGATMGTTFSVKLSPAPDAAARERLRHGVERRLDEVDRQMSTYRADSDLAGFNRSRSTDWHPLPRAVVALVARAGRISRLTEGRYDITVGPLVDLWGFGPAGARASPPPAQAIAAARARVGYRHLMHRFSPPALRKSVGALEVDLSSIAKGWAVDRLAALLEDAGYRNYLIEIGGELRARGERAPGSPWRIAIERPLLGGRAVERVLVMRDGAVATSGDYRNYFDAGGQRYSHTLNPASGRPVRHRLAAVTLFADNCADADAWATALLALGEQRGRALADAQGLKALFIVRDAQGLREVRSGALQRSGLLGPADPPT